MAQTNSLCYKRATCVSPNLFKLHKTSPAAVQDSLADQLSTHFRALL